MFRKFVPAYPPPETGSGKAGTPFLRMQTLYASCAFWSAGDGGGPLFPAGALDGDVLDVDDPTLATPDGDPPPPHAANSTATATSASPVAATFRPLTPRHRSTNCRIRVDVIDASCDDFTDSLLYFATGCSAVTAIRRDVLSVQPGSSAYGTSFDEAFSVWESRDVESSAAFRLDPPSYLTASARSRSPNLLCRSARRFFVPRAHEGNRTERTPCRHRT